ncbi:MAG: PAS domain S-box protein [Syntrophaceae bacterium]|nr:PAS domain S-box protein [Syntrophaceae bacterium]
MKAPKAVEEGRDSLFFRIQWLMLFRVALVTLFLGATVIFQLKGSPFFRQVSPHPFYLLIGFTYALTLVYALLLRRIQRLKTFAYVQILGDVFFITLLIYVTGGIASIFFWLYFFSIFSAGTILYRRGGLWVASASSILYGTLLDLEYYGVLLPPGGRELNSPGYQSTYVLYLVTVNIIAFYLVAFLSSYLAEQVRRKEEEIKKRIIDYRQLERLYKHIVQNVVSGLITVDGEGRITSFNRMAEEITGYKFEEVYQEGIDSLFPGLLAWSRSVGGNPGEGENRLRFFRWETRFVRKDGAHLILGFSISPLKDSEDREMGNILIFQDLTRLREMEEHVKRSDRLAAIGKMAAGIAHEIRNPLASISGSIEILKEELGNSPQNHALMGIVLREVHRLNSLIADFLLFARPVSFGRERIHLNRLIEEILQMLRHSEDFHVLIRLETQFEDDLYIQGNPNQVRQVFWNLLINAVQAMPEGGLLKVRLRKGDPQALLPGSRSFGEVSIIDSGMGIGEGEIGKIFDPFFTTKERGTGLGLSIVHSIVESYGGKITVQSQKSGGSVFSVFLPLQA